jgi:hypothetical protein
MYLIKEIIDSCHHGRGWQYLICWSGYGLKHNHWLSCMALKDCKLLDCWLALERESGMGSFFPMGFFDAPAVVRIGVDMIDVDEEKNFLCQCIPSPKTLCTLQIQQQHLQ